MSLPKPLPREKSSAARRPAKRTVKPMGDVAAQSKSDRNRQSAQALAKRLAAFLRREGVKDAGSIDEAMETVRTLRYHIEIIRVEHLRSVAQRIVHKRIRS